MRAIEQGLDNGSSFRPRGPKEAVYIPEGDPIPVYNFRDLDEQELLAEEIVGKAQLAMFAGVWGGFKAVDATADEEEFFYIAKPGRPKEAKIAVMVPPSKAFELIDWEGVHPDVHHLQESEAFKDLWHGHGAYLHIIAPIRNDAIFPALFKMTPEEYARVYPDHDPVEHTTASLFWRNDPYLEALIERIDSIAEAPIFIGGTSLNRHGEAPPFTYEEVKNHLYAGKADPRQIHAIVRDPIYEGSVAHGSHTQVRLPLAGEKDGRAKVFRIGTLSPEGFSQATNLDILTMPDAKDVRRVPGVNIDVEILEAHQKVLEHWNSKI